MGVSTSHGGRGVRGGPAGRLSLIAAGAAIMLTACGSQVTAVNSGATQLASPLGQASGPPAASVGPASVPSTTAPASAAAPLCLAAGKVDRLVVSRVSVIPGNHFRFVFPRGVTVTVAYRLSFAAGERGFPAVTADPAGCMQITGLGPARRAVAPATFWTVLGQAMGLQHPGESQFRGSMSS